MSKYILTGLLVLTIVASGCTESEVQVHTHDTSEIKGLYDLFKTQMHNSSLPDDYSGDNSTPSQDTTVRDSPKTSKISNISEFVDIQDSRIEGEKAVVELTAKEGVKCNLRLEKVNYVFIDPSTINIEEGNKSNKIGITMCRSDEAVVDHDVYNIYPHPKGHMELEFSWHKSLSPYDKAYNNYTVYEGTYYVTFGDSK